MFFWNSLAFSMSYKWKPTQTLLEKFFFFFIIKEALVGIVSTAPSCFEWRCDSYSCYGSAAIFWWWGKVLGTSLMIRWQRLHAPSAWGPGSSPSQGTKSHVSQPRVWIWQLKILCATMKSEDPTCRNQINRFFFLIEKVLENQSCWLW